MPISAGRHLTHYIRDVNGSPFPFKGAHFLVSKLVTTFSSAIVEKFLLSAI